MPVEQHIQTRRDTAANWTSVNPVLATGEPGLETDTRKVKYGDGTTAWNSLAYAAGGSGAQALARTPVKTGAYTAAAGDLVPGDTTGGAFTVTLPTAPADGSRVGVKHVIQGTSLPALTVALGGSDVLNKTGGSTSYSLPGLNMSAVFQYATTGAIWTVTESDLPLGYLNGTYGPGGTQWLKNDGNWSVTTVSATDTASGLPTSGTVTWIDGTTGTFTGTVNGTAGDYSGYVVTWAGSTTKTVTATGITYDANGNQLGPTSLVVS